MRLVRPLIVKGCGRGQLRLNNGLRRQKKHENLCCLAKSLGNLQYVGGCVSRMQCNERVFLAYNSNQLIVTNIFV